MKPRTDSGRDAVDTESSTDAADAPGPVDAPATKSPDARPPVRFRRALVESLPFGVVSYFVARLILSPWNGDWSRPVFGGGDTSLILMMVKAIQTHGWYLHNPNLGAPFGQQFYDFPSGGETIQLLFLRFISLFTSNPATIIDIFYFAGFPALAIVTYLVVRQLRFSAITSGAIALLYTFLPYHYAQSQSHLYRSAYLSAPVAVLLIIWTLSWRTEFLVRPDATTTTRREAWSALNKRRVAVAAALCVFIAAYETMVLAFFLTVLFVTAVLVAVRRRDRGTAATAAAMVVVCGLTFGLVMVPNLRFWSAHGSNDVTARRYPAEQELYGLKPSQLLLPVPDHRIAALRGIQTDARDKRPFSSEEGQGLGFIGALGLLGALGWVLTRGVERRRDGPPSDRTVLMGYAGLGAAVAILFGTASGFALVLSLAGFSQIRVWNRIVVLIALFSFLPVAIVFDRLLDRARRNLARFGAGALVVVLTAFGIYDTSGWLPPIGQRADIGELTTFVHATERVLPRSSMIFQLPVTRFPEVPPTGSSDLYDQLLPYLWSNPSADLRWSGGGMKGRPAAEWQARVTEQGVVQSLPGLVGLGFDALELDTHAYEPEDLPNVLADLEAALGPPVTESTSGRWRLWDLRRYAADHRLSSAELRAAAERLVGPQITADPDAVTG